MLPIVTSNGLMGFVAQQNDDKRNASVTVTSNADDTTNMIPTMILGKKRPRSSSCNNSRKKQVQFVNNDVSAIIVSPPSLQQEHQEEEESYCSWYNRTELAIFKLQLRNYILNGRGLHPQQDHHLQLWVESDDFTSRGYERHSMERSWNKKLAIRSTLLAYRRGHMTDDQLSQMYQSCTQGSKQEAFKLACQDYCDVYYSHPTTHHFNNLSLLMTSSMPDMMTNMKKKHDILLSQTQYHPNNTMKRTMVTTPAGAAATRSVRPRID